MLLFLIIGHFLLYYCIFSAVFRELLKTEEDFVQELHHVINTYVKIFDDPATPSVVRQLREQLTLNLRELYNFHAKYKNTVLFSCF